MMDAFVAGEKSGIQPAALSKALNEITVGTVYEAGTPTSMRSLDLADSLESEDFHVGAWCWMLDTTYPVAAFGERRILSYHPAGGVVTFSRDWSEARATGLDFEIHRMLRPSTLATASLRHTSRLRCHTG